jgi:hypothetical protein
MKRTNNPRGKYSLSKKLRLENKSNDYFELMLGNLPLEDIIALKLEIAYRSIGFPLLDFPLWKNFQHISKEALLKYVCSVSNTKTEARRILGIDSLNFLKMMKKYRIEAFPPQRVKKDVDNQ